MPHSSDGGGRDTGVVVDAGISDPDGSAGDSGPVGSGARCGPSGRNDCGPFLACSPSLGCVECLTDTDCPAARGRCLVGACVGCRPVAPDDAGVTDCPSGACWTSDYECHSACARSSDCPAGLICDVATGQCRGCTEDRDCASGVCALDRHQCVTCVKDSQCPRGTPRCRGLTGTCVSCTANEDCGRAAPICDPVSFTCREGCSSDAQCPGRRCDLAAARCVDLAPVDAGPRDAAGE